jgi:hypothetical protein
LRHLIFLGRTRVTTQNALIEVLDGKLELLDQMPGTLR